MTAKQEHGALGEGPVKQQGWGSVISCVPQGSVLSGVCYQLPGYWILSVLMMPYPEVPLTPGDYPTEGMWRRRS